MHPKFAKYAPQAVAKDGEPPQDDGMEHRVTVLETRLETILPTLATKTDIEGVRTDLHKMDASNKAWMVGTIIALFFGFSALIFTAFQSFKVVVDRPAATAPAAQQNPDGTKDQPGVVQP